MARNISATAPASSPAFCSSSLLWRIRNHRRYFLSSSFMRLMVEEALAFSDGTMLPLVLGAHLNSKARDNKRGGTQLRG